MIEMDSHVLYRTQFLDHFSNLELCLSRRSLYQTTVTVQTQMCKTNRTECLRTVGRSTQSAVLTTVHILLIFCITAPRNVLPFQLTVQSKHYLRTIYIFLYITQHYLICAAYLEQHRLRSSGTITSKLVNCAIC